MTANRTITFTLPEDLAHVVDQMKNQAGFTISPLPDGRVRVIVDRGQLDDASLDELAAILNSQGITIHY